MHGLGTELWAQVSTRVLLGIIVAGCCALCFFGHRLVKPVLSLFAAAAGFFAGTAGTAQFVDDNRIVYGVGVACGVFFALVALFLFSLSIFLLGAALGIVGLVQLNTAVHGEIFKDSVPRICTFLCAAFVGGFVALRAEKHILITATTLGGSFGAVRALEQMMPEPEFDLADVFRGDSESCTQQCWLLLGAWAALAMAGMATQYHMLATHTGKDDELRPLLAAHRAHEAQ